MMTDDEIRELVRVVLQASTVEMHRGCFRESTEMVRAVEAVRGWQARKEAASRDTWLSDVERLQAAMDEATAKRLEIRQECERKWNPWRTPCSSEAGEPERPKTDLMDEQERAAMVRASLAQDQFAVAGATWAKHRDEIVLKAWTSDSQT